MKELYVEKGDAVAPDQAVAVVEGISVWRADVERLRALLAAREAEHARLVAGSREEEIQQARSRRDALAAQLERLRAGPRPREIEVARTRVAVAEANHAALAANHARLQRLSEGESVTEGDLETSRLQVQAAAARVAGAKQELAMAEEGYRREEVAAAEASLAEAEAALALVMSGPRREDIDRAAAVVRAARAEMAHAEAEVELSTIRSPIAGVVLDVHARPGERVGSDGVIEVGATAHMYVVAEVYETDIARVAVGQPATVTSPTFAAPLTGTVERIGLRIGRRDVLDTDPVEDADARVVEVEIRLDEPEAAARLTNLRVDVRIDTESGP